MGDDSILSNIIGVFGAIINNYQTKKAIETIHKMNAANQGITHYLPSQIEAFFDDSEQMANMAFSGGENEYRTRAISRAVECATRQNYSVIILHGSNRLLEQRMRHLSGNNLIAINPNNPIYDPFIGLTNSEISRMILASTNKGFEIQGQGKYYIDGISDFIRVKKIQPYCNMYITCPHLTLIDKVNDAETKGVIPSNTARNIISQIMQGEIERGNVENFFTGFANQSQNILVTKKDLNRATNIKQASTRNQIIMIDVLSNTNCLLINMLINEVENLLSQGKKVFLVVDNIQLTSSDALQNLNKRSGINCNLVMSSDDVFSSFGGDDNLFFSFIGKASKLIVFKHASAYSCQKWSDVIGSYDKHEINSAFAQNTNYIGRFGMGSTQTASVNVKRENIVKPEEINRMRMDEVYIMSKSSGELAHTTIV